MQSSAITTAFADAERKVRDYEAKAKAVTLAVDEGRAAVKEVREQADAERVTHAEELEKAAKAAGQQTLWGHESAEGQQQGSGRGGTDGDGHNPAWGYGPIVVPSEPVKAAEQAEEHLQKEIGPGFIGPQNNPKVYNRQQVVEEPQSAPQPPLGRSSPSQPLGPHHTPERLAAMQCAAALRVP